jgi:hypothetical protein
LRENIMSEKNDPGRGDDVRRLAIAWRLAENNLQVLREDSACTEAHGPEYDYTNAHHMDGIQFGAQTVSHGRGPCWEEEPDDPEVWCDACARRPLVEEAMRVRRTAARRLRRTLDRLIVNPLTLREE